MLKETKSGTWSQAEKWVYEWNPRDQMNNHSVIPATHPVIPTKVGIQGPAFPAWIPAFAGMTMLGAGSNPGTLLSGKRYEYDGLNVLRADELYDNDSNGLEDNDGWRRIEVNTHRPGSLGAHIGKRVYSYSSGTSGTPSGQNDYTYSYDAVGNVVAVYNANSTNRGNELYFFSQDAFGNELSSDTGASLLGGSEWDVARSNGISEHQTGKTIDPFTGLYFFHARWYDSGVGRFVSKDRIRQVGAGVYAFCYNNPVSLQDPAGLDCVGCGPIHIPGGPGDEFPGPKPNPPIPSPLPPLPPPPTPTPNPIPPFPGFPPPEGPILGPLPTQSQKPCSSCYACRECGICGAYCAAKAAVGIEIQLDIVQTIGAAVSKSPAQFCRQAAKKILGVATGLGYIIDANDFYQCMRDSCGVNYPWEN